MEFEETRLSTDSVHDILSSQIAVIIDHPALLEDIICSKVGCGPS